MFKSRAYKNYKSVRIEITFRFSGTTVKPGFKELLNKEQPGNSEPFPVTNLPVNKLALVNNFTISKKFLITKFDGIRLAFLNSKIIFRYYSNCDTFSALNFKFNKL